VCALFLSSDWLYFNTFALIIYQSIDSKMFAHIDDGELAKIIEATDLITVLIAGADGKIDDREVEWATKLTDIRSYAYAEELQDYYSAVGSDFEARLSSLIQSLPEDTQARNEEISSRLTDLNPILAKLDNSIGAILYDSYTSFAKHVAKSSGGFLRFASISREEKALIDLPMIEPIYLIMEDEDA